jgi:hypothetical protein
MLPLLTLQQVDQGNFLTGSTDDVAPSLLELNYGNVLSEQYTVEQTEYWHSNGGAFYLVSFEGEASGNGSQNYNGLSRVNEETYCEWNNIGSCGCDGGNGGGNWDTSGITPIGTWSGEVGGAFLKGLNAGAATLGYSFSFGYAGSDAKEKTWQGAGLDGTWTQTISQGAANVSAGTAYAAGGGAIANVAKGIASKIGSLWGGAAQTAPKYSSKVTDVGNAIKDWLGSNSGAITNKAGDLIFQSKNGLREIRFDFKNFLPHNKQHIHLIEFKMKKNKKIKLLDERYFFDP